MVVSASPVGYGYHRISISGQAIRFQIAPAILSTRGILIIGESDEEVKRIECLAAFSFKPVAASQIRPSS